MSDKQQQTIDARACARMLLDTLPGLMRGIFGARRHSKPDDEALSMGQFRMLEILRHAPRTLSELATLHHVTPSTMSRTVDVLVRREWVDRRSALNDRRQIILTLTDEGQEALAASRQQNYDIAARLLEQLSQDEQVRLYDGLLVLQELVQRISAEQSQCLWKPPFGPKDARPDAGDSDSQSPKD